MNTTNIYNGLNYSTKLINNNFKIKVFGIFNGKKTNTLVGISGLIKMIGIDLTNKLFARAIKCITDKIDCKLRRGLKVSFYRF